MAPLGGLTISRALCVHFSDSGSLLLPENKRGDPRWGRGGERMKDLIGGPGTVSGLLLRFGQSAFAAASIGAMVTAHGFSGYTAFW